MTYSNIDVKRIVKRAIKTLHPVVKLIPFLRKDYKYTIYTDEQGGCEIQVFDRRDWDSNLQERKAGCDPDLAIGCHYAIFPVFPDNNSPDQQIQWFVMNYMSSYNQYENSYGEQELGPFKSASEALMSVFWNEVNIMVGDYYMRPGAR